MVVVVSWFGPVLMPLRQDGVPSLMKQGILKYNSESKIQRDFREQLKVHKPFLHRTVDNYVNVWERSNQIYDLH